MFGPRYFGPRYFGPRYFGVASGTTPPPPGTARVTAFRSKGTRLGPDPRRSRGVRA